MRVRFTIPDNPHEELPGDFIGLMQNEHGETEAVIHPDNHGLYLVAVHPSRVTFVRKETG